MTLQTLRAIPFAVVATLLATAPTSASCVLPPSLEEHLRLSDVVFVGRVINLENHDRTATFQVEEQWSGAALPASVTVLGGPPDATSATSVDRTFAKGRYLVAASAAGATLTDSACSATRPWTDDLAQFRPAEVRIPPTAEEAADGGGSFPWFLGVIAAVAVVAVAAFTLTSSRRTA